jgi:ATP-dependent Clp protease ATP-binding subunit ClpB
VDVLDRAALVDDHLDQLVHDVGGVPYRAFTQRAGLASEGQPAMLTESVRRKPYSVVLFNEVEKAHHDVFNTLLQVLDDGRLTDAQGRTVNFRNTVLIMTSSIGSQYLLEGLTAEAEITPQARELVMSELRHHFHPEFLNRIDDIVLFSPLTQAQIEQIVELMFNELRTRLAERRITLEVSDEARRFIAREVETRIGRALLADAIPDGATIRIKLKGDELIVTHDDLRSATSTAT